MINNKKIALITIDFPIQAYMRDFINILVKSNIDVDLYYNSDLENFIEENTLNSKNHKLIIPYITKKILQIIGKVSKTFFKKLNYGDIEILTKKIKKKDYSFIIAIEKKSLLLANEIIESNKIIYYSLELYYQDHPNFKNYEPIVLKEINILEKINTLIIQDRYREKALKEFIGKSFDKSFLIPIGTRELVVTNYHNKNKHQKLKILYFGVINEFRNENLILKLTVLLKKDECLYLRVPKTKLQENNKIKIITKKLSEQNLNELINECDIGLALYSNEFSNNRLTAYSSHKIAMYLAHGKPLIVLKNETYIDLFEQFKCGEMVEGIDEIREKIDLIRANYSTYSDNAKKAFNNIYNLDKSRAISNLIEFIKDDNLKSK